MYLFRNTDDRSGTILGLDGIRALAVVFVITTHLGASRWLSGFGDIGRKLNVLTSGTAGVQIFLVLSGYLITTLLIREFDRHGSVSIVNFYIRRSLRILPLYTLFCVMAISMGLIGADKSVFKGIAYLLTMTYNFVPKSQYSGMLAHTWTLAVEEHFYLIWPAIFAFLFSVRGGSKLVWVAGCSVVTMWSLGHYLHTPKLDAEYFLYRWTIVAGAPIFLGCIVALLINSGHHKIWWQSVFRSKLTLALGLMLYCSILLTPMMIFEFRTVGVALILGWIGLNQRNVIVRSLEFWPLVYIGQISYGLYIWQGFFLSTGPWRAPNQTWPPDQAIGLILLCLVAPLSWHGFEKPILGLKDRLQKRREASTSSASTPMG